MQVIAYNLSVTINPWAKDNLEATGTIRLKNDLNLCPHFSLYLNPELELVETDGENIAFQVKDNTHPLGFAGREIRLHFDPPVKAHQEVEISLKWSGKLKGIIWGYCMIAPHLIELRDFACWYPLPSGDVKGFTWQMELNLPPIAYPLPMAVVCNGERDNQCRWRSQGTTTDINILASSYFQSLKDEGDNSTINTYYAFMSHGQAQDITGEMQMAVDYFSKAIGKNPGVKQLNCVFSPRYAEGGYVYGPLTVMSEPQYQHFLNFPELRPDVSLRGNAHELAHYWWREQVRVDRSSWNDWLMEALAEYWAAMFDEFIEPGRAQKIFANYRARVTSKSLKPISKTTFNTPNRYEIWYLKGAWIIRMLHQVLGNGDFQRAIRLFYQRYKGQTTTTQDFIQCCQEVSTRNLSGFFQQWLDRGDIPELAVEWSQRGREVAVRITQDYKDKPFNLDIPITLKTARRGRTENVMVNRATQEFSFFVPEKVTQVVLDPLETVLFKRRGVEK